MARGWQQPALGSKQTRFLPTSTLLICRTKSVMPSGQAPVALPSEQKGWQEHMEAVWTKLGSAHLPTERARLCLNCGSLLGAGHRLHVALSQPGLPSHAGLVVVLCCVQSLLLLCVPHQAGSLLGRYDLFHLHGHVLGK